jgi:hypothetical protein
LRSGARDCPTEAAAPRVRRVRITMMTTAATLSATTTTAPVAMVAMAPTLSPSDGVGDGIGADGHLVQPLTEYVPMQVRPLTDALTVTVDPPFEHVVVAVEPSSKVMVESKEDAVPMAHRHPETRKGVYVMAPEAELVMV